MLGTVKRSMTNLLVGHASPKDGVCHRWTVKRVIHHVTGAIDLAILGSPIFLPNVDIERREASMALLDRGRVSQAEPAARGSCP
jgi:hypothetical protein